MDCPTTDSQASQQTCSTHTNKDTQYEASRPKGIAPSTVVSAEPATMIMDSRAKNHEANPIHSTLGASNAHMADIPPLRLPATTQRRQLPPRRAGTRTDEERFRDCMIPLSQAPLRNQIEQLRQSAMIEGDETSDSSAIAATVLNVNGRAGTFSKGSSSTNNSKNELESAEAAGQSASSINPPPPKRKLLRRAERQEFDINRYCPVLGDESKNATESLPQPQNGHEPAQPISPPSKRPRIGRNETPSHPSAPFQSSGPHPRIGLDDIAKIEGPATKMLRADAARAQNALKRKAQAETITHTEEPEKRSRKKARGASLSEESDEPSPRRRQRGRKMNIEPSSKTKTEDAKNKKQTIEGKSERFLVVKARGKKIAEHELEANREFNKLRISKPALLKPHKTESRRIGWDEEDLGEEELRQMNEWTKGSTDGLGSKCFFKTKYVSMLRTPKATNAPPCKMIITMDEQPNFKRFRPVNGVSSGSSLRRRPITLETVRLKRGGVEEWETPPKAKSKEQRRGKHPDDESGDEEDNANTFQRFPTRDTEGTMTSRTPIAPSYTGHARAAVLDSPNTVRGDTQDASDGDEDNDDYTYRGRATATRPTPGLQKARSQGLQVHATQQPRAMTRRKDARPVARRPQRSISNERDKSDSDADDLAFKGFGRG